MGTALGSLAGCAGSSAGGAGADSAAVKQTSQVAMRDSQYSPRNIHVSTGTTVTWTNEDSFEHTVTSASDNWSMDATVPPGEKTTHTFEEGGVYDVYCRFHGSQDPLSGMSMKIGVGDGAIEDPLAGGGGGGGSGGYY